VDPRTIHAARGLRASYVPSKIHPLPGMINHCLKKRNDDNNDTYAYSIPQVVPARDMKLQ